VKIGYFQFSPVIGETSQNRQRLVDAVLQTDADLLVAPELATSGYFFASTEQARELSEPIPGPTTDALVEAAAKTGCTVVIGLPERAGNTLYNSAVVVGPEGIIGTYRKIHLFNEEKLHFTPGEEGFFSFDLNGVKVGILVCFDHMFPEAARTLALQGVQIVCHPSDLVLPEYGQLTSRVRALENRMYWILANRWGYETVGEKTLTYTGSSQVVNPRGRILIRAEAASDDISAVEIDPNESLDKDITEYNHLLNDRRPEFYFYTG
jgi:predicted amidohydrolase